MKLFLKGLLFFVVSSPVALFSQPGVDYIERNYFADAEIQNHSVSAARYAEEAYFYIHQANNRSALADYRADIDTVLFYLGKTTELGGLALQIHTSEDTIAAYLERGLLLIGEAEHTLREVYPFRKLPVMQQYSETLLVNLMNAKIDFYTASLYLSDGSLQPGNEGFEYEELNLDSHVARLDADESSFTDLVLEMEERMRVLNEEIEALRNAVNSETDGGNRAELQNQLNELLEDRKKMEAALNKANHRLQDIRDQQQAMEQQQDLLSAEDENKDGDETSDQFETDRHGYYNNKEVAVNEPLPQGLVYRIQLGYYFKTTTNDAFRGLFPITGEDLKDGKIRYYAGMFSSYREASKAKDYIREKRISDAFVVPYLDGKKINVKRAIELERELLSQP